jgi:hypothetical protein
VRQDLFGELDVHFPRASGVARLGGVIVVEKALSSKLERHENVTGWVKIRILTVFT